jgi:hypothetical protein
MRATTRRRLSGGIAGLLLCLTGGVLAEALPASQDHSVEGTLPPVTLPVAAEAAPDAPPIDDWVSTVLDRPLFALDRRPDAAAAAPNDALPRLSGIIRLANTALAIFQPKGPHGGGRSLLVSQGAEIAGWTVTDITNTEVTLVRDGQIATLHLAYADLPWGQQGVAGVAVRVLHDKRSSVFWQP